MPPCGPGAPPTTSDAPPQTSSWLTYAPRGVAADLHCGALCTADLRRADHRIPARACCSRRISTALLPYITSSTADLEVHGRRGLEISQIARRLDGYPVNLLDLPPPPACALPLALVAARLPRSSHSLAELRLARARPLPPPTSSSAPAAGAPRRRPAL
jgi:hypothetical protein